MPRYLLRAALQSLLLILALVLAQSGPLLAQQSSFAALTPVAGEPRSDDPVETASLEPALAAAPPMPAGGASMALVALTPVAVQTKAPAPHPFWDRKNKALFATVGAVAAADFCATRANLASGGKELNPMTRVFSGSTPGLAANFALETGSVIGISYLFHKTGHHKLERITAIVSIGASATAAGYSFSHR